MFLTGESKVSPGYEP